MTVPAEVLELRSPRAIRERCRRIFEAGLRDELVHFQVDLSRLDAAAAITAEVTRERYPSLVVPAHSRLSHFNSPGMNRERQIDTALQSATTHERACALFDLVVVSVLLDAGAGADYRYRAPDTGEELRRSEALAVASLHWLASGALSSRRAPYAVDAPGLSGVDAEALAKAFQVGPDNPLVGVSGRVHLLKQLATALRERPTLFGPEARPCGLLDFFSRCAPDGPLPAERVLSALLDGLGDIWPSRLSLAGVALGDCFRHPEAGGSGRSEGLVPFHKLSQWLTYSLIAPTEAAGFSVVELDGLTGLAEYRNGGLFMDTGVLTLKDPAAAAAAHPVDSELVVEWRALTVALLDELAPRVRSQLGKSARELPLPSVLEGGSWAAGRKLAAQRRKDGGPPLRVVSDGTVF